MGTIDKTRIPEFARYVFTIDKMVKSYSRYRSNDIFSDNVLNVVIRIKNIYNKYVIEDIVKHLSFKTTTDWGISKKTIKLFPSEVQGVYLGNLMHNNKNTLLIARFMADDKGIDNCPDLSLIIDIFPNYYPSDEETILDIITQ
jgi:hypothetical protein